MNMDYLGIHIIESKYATKMVQDWSGCRSVPRAKRRHAKGIKTRMVEKEVPAFFMIDRKIVEHPLVVQKLKSTNLK